MVNGRTGNPGANTLNSSGAMGTRNCNTDPPAASAVERAACQLSSVWFHPNSTPAPPKPSAGLITNRRRSAVA